MKLGNPIVSGFRPETLPANKKSGLSSLALAQQIRKSSATALAEQSRKIAMQTTLAKPQNKQATEAEERAKVEKEQRRRQCERELRACRTKKDVEAVRARWRMMFMTEIKAIERANLPPDEKAAKLEEARERYAEKEEVAMEFMGSEDYQKLPNEEKEEEKRKNALRDLTRSVLEGQAEKPPTKVERAPEDASESTLKAAPSASSEPTQVRQDGEAHLVPDGRGQTVEGAQTENEPLEALEKSGGRISVYA